MFRSTLIMASGVAAALVTPASAQTFYRPNGQSATVVNFRQPFNAGPNRFFLPVLRDIGVSHAEAPEGHEGGAVATSPSGRRVYYIPAPASEPQTMRVARAAVGDEDAGLPPRQRSIDPRFLRQEVAYNGNHRPGTIVINSAERHLYLVLPGGRALRYGIGVGREGFGWRGEKTVTRMAEWPDWRPPVEMLQRRPDLPRFMPGGPNNPLGARALYLGSSLYRIHGTNEPHTIGQAVSSGCFRMMNEDVVDLYNRVRVGARVVVL